MNSSENNKYSLVHCSLPCVTSHMKTLLQYIEDHTLLYHL